MNFSPSYWQATRRVSLRSSGAATPRIAAVAADLFFVAAVRPRLDQGAGGDSLWLSRSGSPLAEHSIYIAITGLTQRTFGTALNPHLFRHIFATSVSIADPEAIEGARAALGHATRHTTQHHYNRAFAFTSARKHADIVQHLRARTNSQG